MLGQVWILAEDRWRREGNQAVAVVQTPPRDETVNTLFPSEHTRDIIAEPSGRTFRPSAVHVYMMPRSGRASSRPSHDAHMQVFGPAFAREVRGLRDARGGAEGGV